MEIVPNNDTNFPHHYKNLNQNYLVPNNNTAQTKKIQNYQFNMNQILGKGNFSKVYKGFNQITNQIVAIKVVELNSIKTPALLQLLYQQIDILKMIKHPNILNCFEVFSSTNNCYIITQLCNEGDVQTKIRSKGPLEQKDAKKIIHEVFQGLKYLDEQHIVHRDLKVANVFMKNGIAKIADFGFAKITNEQFKDINIGSPIYMSPQGLIQNIYGPKTDVWAFGVFIYQILHGDTPLGFCKTQPELKFHIVNPTPFQKLKLNLSNDLKDLILRCLEIDFRKRISFKEMEYHPYIQKLNRQFTVKPLSVILNRNQMSSNQKYNNLLQSQNYQKQVSRSNSVNKINGIPISINIKPQSSKKIEYPQKILMTTLSPNRINRPNTLQIPVSIENRKLSPRTPFQNFQSNSRLEAKRGANLSFKIENSDNKRNTSIQKQRNYNRNYSQNPNPQTEVEKKPESKKLLMVQSKQYNNVPHPPRILDKSTQKKMSNSPLPKTPITKLINHTISFQQTVQLLHYFRLLYKSIAMLKKMNIATFQKLIDLYSTWLLDILDEIQIKIHTFVRYEGEKANIKQKKLKEVISQYCTKYKKQLTRNSMEISSLDNVQANTIKYLYFIDTQINMSPPDKHDLINISFFLFVIYQTGVLIQKCIQLHQFAYLIKNSNLQSFLSSKNFEGLNYSTIQSKLKLLNEYNNN